MISLKTAIKIVEEIRGEEMPFVYTTLTIQEWARKGVISRIKVDNGNARYPEIITAEILVAFRLKNKYNLEKIAEARNYLELEGGKNNQINEKDLIRFVNCSKLFNDKKLVSKLTLNHINSLDTIKEIIDGLVEERERLEIVEDYLKEFLQANREIKEYKNIKNSSYVS